MVIDGNAGVKRRASRLSLRSPLAAPGERSGKTEKGTTTKREKNKAKDKEKSKE